MPDRAKPRRFTVLRQLVLVALFASALALAPGSLAGAQAPALTCEAAAGVVTWVDDGAPKPKYWVYRSTNDGGSWEWIGRTLGDATFTDSDPTVGATYQVRYANASPFECATTAETPGPDGPFACQVDNGNLTWSDHGQSKYWIYRSTNGKHFNWIGRTLGETSFADPHPPRRAIYQVHYANHPRVVCDDAEADKPENARSGVRFASFNASLNRNNAGDLATELATPGSAQPDAVAEIIQRTRPDVLLINEFDYDPDGDSLAAFQTNYLSVPHGSAEAIEYPYRYAAPSNTGIASGADLDNSGAAGDFAPNDSFGFGFFPGQFGMAVYSKYPIDESKVRTFQNFLWADMPDALLPVEPDGTPWYSDEELEIVRLSSKSHWDLPIKVGRNTVHFLVSHPTPPVFDGPEDRNGTRNHDEIRFWADYVNPWRSHYIYDDDGGRGGLHRRSLFVIAGDQNADPFDGDSVDGAIGQLLDNPRINTRVTPASAGGEEQAELQGDNNADHIGDPSFDTADFGEAQFNGPGNLRVDYVLPKWNMRIRNAGVFWPTSDDPTSALTGTFPFPASDHRLVWVDLGIR